MTLTVCMLLPTVRAPTANMEPWRRWRTREGRRHTPARTVSDGIFLIRCTICPASDLLLGFLPSCVWSQSLHIKVMSHNHCTVPSPLCVQIGPFPPVRGGARVKPGSVQLIPSFSLLNAVTLKGQGTGHTLMLRHSYSNCAAATSGASRLFHVRPFHKSHGGLHPQDPLAPRERDLCYPMC